MKYKIGDKVRIKSLDWYNGNKDEDDNVVCLYSYFDKGMSEFCDKIVTIKSLHGCPNVKAFRIIEDNGYSWWSDDMIEGLVKEENKPKFKVGDEVRIKGTDIGGTIESIIRGQLIVETKGSKIPVWPEEVVLIEGLVEEETALNKWTGLKVELELSKSVIGVSNVESLHGERFMSGFVKAIIPPEGYQFTDENGNVINATKIVLEKKKKEYPKTYEECIGKLPINWDGKIEGYKCDLLTTFQKLLICRDAYWKIAGEEMGLGKPWELSIGIPIYYIYYNRTLGTIKKDYADDIQGNVILAFPTAEMRDAFKENFDPDIEICKEFL